MLGRFLWCGFICLGHKCQDHWSLCDGMRGHTDRAWGYVFIRKSGLGPSPGHKGSHYWHNHSSCRSHPFQCQPRSTLHSAGNTTLALPVSPSPTPPPSSLSSSPPQESQGGLAECLLTPSVWLRSVVKELGHCRGSLLGSVSTMMVEKERVVH